MSISTGFLNSTIRRLKYYKDLGEKAIEQLSEAEMNFQPGPESNSIAVIIRHMSGNMLSRWTNFLTEDGEKPWRKRDDEFEEGNYSKPLLKDSWNKGWNCFLEALASLEKKDLKKTVKIRDEELTVTDAIIRQLAHYTYHAGQIIYIARMIREANWKNLSIPKGASATYNKDAGVKDPAKKFS